LPGAGGAPEIATSAKEVLLVLKQSKRSFVNELDFVTSSGYPVTQQTSPLARGRGQTTVITDLGVMVSDPLSHELILVAMHPGVELQEVRDETGWDLKVAADLQRSAAPTEYELQTLRELNERTSIAHAMPSSNYYSVTAASRESEQ
jgi:glutaconate CoA-transferase subunit B